MGRFCCIHGIRGKGPFDRELRNVKIFSMLGELLKLHEKLASLTGF